MVHVYITYWRLGLFRHSYTNVVTLKACSVYVESEIQIYGLLYCE